MHEDLELWATGREPVTVALSVGFAADFAHLFDVKAGRGRPATTPTATIDGFEFRDPDGDGDDDGAVGPDARRARRRRRTRALDALGAAGSAHGVVDRRRARPGAGADGERSSSAAGDPLVVRRLPAWGSRAPSVTSTDGRWSEAVDQALADLAALRIPDADHPDRIVVAAGAPWYMTLFGRDSLLTSWMLLPFDHVLVNGVLSTLAELQGTRHDPIAEEEPGKILHEVRTLGGEGPFASRDRYFGSVDATPLFVATAAEAWRWGALDDAALATLAPAIERAVAWIRRHLHGAGLVTYRRRDPRGLANQGWKDSWDGVTFADGSLPEAPIALIEVQGYAYDALRGAAAMAAAGLLAARPGRPRAATRPGCAPASTSSSGIPRGWFVLGLDGAGRRIDALTTNPGHALWSGIAEPELADRYLDRITEPDMWTGWGLRTLAATHGRLRPAQLPQRLGLAARHGDLRRRRRPLRPLGRRRPHRRRHPRRHGGPGLLARPSSSRGSAATTSRCRSPIRPRARRRPGRPPRCSCSCAACSGSTRQPDGITLRRTDLAPLDGLTVRRAAAPRTDRDTRHRRPGRILAQR